MKIGLIGCGALGTLFAALLSRVRGNEVWFLDRNERRSRNIDRKGLAVSGLTNLRVPPGRVRSACSARRIGPCDLVIVLVKSFDTQQAVGRAMPCVGARTLVLTLQNGLDNLSAIRKCLKGRPVGGILGGTTAQGATLLGWGRVRHAGSEPTLIGADGARQAKQARCVAACLNEAGIRSRAVRGAERLIWSKVVINSAMNPLGALLRVRNGELVRNQAARMLLRGAARESASVARAAGIRLIYPDPEKKVEQVCRATARNFNSMLQDHLRGRRTEIEHINGAVVRRARGLGVPAPINTAFLRCLTNSGD